MANKVRMTEKADAPSGNQALDDARYWRVRDLHLLRHQFRHAGSLGQFHHRHQPPARHEVLLVE